jgi:hypothetical protein
MLWEKILRTFAQHSDIRFVNQVKAPELAAERV